jgi:hypothetical protein
MIKFRVDDMQFECDTADEVTELLKQLQAEKEKKVRRERRSPMVALIADLAGWDETHTSPWNRTSFWTFLESLGEPQKRVLTLLVQKRRLKDEELREALHLDSNTQLAGVLSGISKQAGAHNLPARAVFTIENEAKGGQVTKSYVVALDFLRIATEMNWPE